MIYYIGLVAVALGAWLSIRGTSSLTARISMIGILAGIYYYFIH